MYFAYEPDLLLLKDGDKVLTGKKFLRYVVQESWFFDLADAVQEMSYT